MTGMYDRGFELLAEAMYPDGVTEEEILDEWLENLQMEADDRLLNG